MRIGTANIYENDKIMYLILVSNRQPIVVGLRKTFTDFQPTIDIIIMEEK